MARAAALIAERQRAGKRTHLLLSISQQSMLDDSMAFYVGEQLREAGIPGEQLMLAVAEAKVFANLREAQDFAKALGDFGSRLALERFGAGLNSLQILDHFQPALLKVDPQFVEDLAKNPESQEKLKGIAERASASEIRTIAPHVQDASSMTLLFSAGVDYVQGDFLAPAGPDMNYDFS